MMFLLMVRVTDPLMPRAMFGVLNTLLYFPSGAVYPQQGFPALDAGDRGRSIRSPMRCTRSRACCSRTPASTRSAAISVYLLVFSVVAMTRGDAAVQADAMSRQMRSRNQAIGRSQAGRRTDIANGRHQRPRRERSPHSSDVARRCGNARAAATAGKQMFAGSRLQGT